MAIANIGALTSNTQANAATATTAAANTTGAGATTLGTFSATFAQVLAQLGPLALDTLLTTTGTGTNNGVATGPISGFTSTVFNLLLLQSLGQGNLANQPVTQRLLTAQVLLSTTEANDPLGLGVVATDEVVNALVRQGANGNLFVQLNNVSTQPNPLLFSAGALAQAFQIGNGTGSPP